jgi:predicted TIM-barrel fold metal-dependent hydrolase
MNSIDADAHVIEIPYTWEFMDEADKKYAPVILTQTSGAEMHGNDGSIAKKFWLIDNKIHARDRNVGHNTTEEAREMRDIDVRLKHMDELDIGVQVLYPTIFLRPLTKKAAVDRALCQSYNRWLAEIWKKSAGRLRWVAMAPMLSLSTDKSVVREELEFAKKNGACGIFMRALDTNRRITDPYFHPFFELAGELDLALCFHAGNGSHDIHDFYIDEAGFSKFKLPAVGTFHSMINEGLPEKFPELRWAFIETSSQWVPYVLNDLALRFKKRGSEMGENVMARKNIYVACQVTDDIPYVLKSAGEDNLVVGTDYGHHDTSTEIEALRLIKQNGDVDAAVIDKILYDNACKLYGLS